MLFWLNELGYAMSALDEEPAGPDVPSLPADFRVKEHPAPGAAGDRIIWMEDPVRPVERERWQTEYDRPEFRLYTAFKRRPEA